MPGMEMPHFFPLGEGIELTQMERQEDQLVLHVAATSPSALCPLCQKKAVRLHSRYRQVVKDLPCAGQQVKLILYAPRSFVTPPTACARSSASRLPHLVAPWAQMTTRLTQALCKCFHVMAEFLHEYLTSITDGFLKRRALRPACQGQSHADEQKGDAGIPPDTSQNVPPSHEDIYRLR